MTRGAQDTESVSILGYNQLISRLNLGLGSAVSVLIFMLVLVIAFLFVARLRARRRRAPRERSLMQKRGPRARLGWTAAIVIVIFYALIPGRCGSSRCRSRRPRR